MRLLFSMLFLSVLSLPLTAQEIQAVHSCEVDGVAVGGYDLVSYHEDSGPRKGSADFSYTHGELSYLFSNRDNLEIFRKDGKTSGAAGLIGFC